MEYPGPRVSLSVSAEGTTLLRHAELFGLRGHDDLITVHGLRHGVVHVAFSRQSQSDRLLHEEYLEFNEGTELHCTVDLRRSRQPKAPARLELVFDDRPEELAEVQGDLLSFNLIPANDVFLSDDQILIDVVSLAAPGPNERTRMSPAPMLLQVGTYEVESAELGHLGSFDLLSPDSRPRIQIPKLAIAHVTLDFDEGVSAPRPGSFLVYLSDPASRRARIVRRIAPLEDHLISGVVEDNVVTLCTLPGTRSLKFLLHGEMVTTTLELPPGESFHTWKVRKPVVLPVEIQRAGRPHPLPLDAWADLELQTPDGRPASHVLVPVELEEEDPSECSRVELLVSAPGEYRLSVSKCVGRDSAPRAVVLGEEGKLEVFSY